ncbi:MAG TPA: hypothetical protein VN775_11985 [Opitutaceae bacterium]|nr:hypothetical protein [Opitutaceae bacterium]
MPRERPDPHPLTGRSALLRVSVLTLSLCAAVAFYAWAISPEGPSLAKFDDGTGYYNLLIRGFRSGHLSLQAEVPPGLLKLKDPYDPAQNAQFGMHDVSFYKGKFYLYFGAAPALVLYWPVAALSGRYLDDRQAIFLFSTAAFLAGSYLLIQIRRRYFPGAGLAAEAGGIVAMGFANMVPVLLRRPQFYEVAITAAFAFFILSLVGLYQSLHRERRLGWLAFASLCYGLAIASRPTYLFGAAALLVPVVLGPAPETRPGRGGPARLALACAALVPVGLVVAGIMAYNELRFDNPFEFGVTWALSGFNETKITQFSPSYVWYNCRAYLFAPANLSAYFPFVRVVSLPPTPAGHYGVEDPYGILPNMPFAALALAAVLACASRPRLRPFALAAALSSFAVACVIFTFQFATNRYMVDFLPGFIILGVIGFWGVREHFSGLGRRAVTAGCWVLLVWSALFNVFASFAHNELLRVNDPALFRRLEHAFNTPRYVCDRLVGRTYGPLELTVRFPTDKKGKLEPLVITGLEFLSDYLYVYYASNDKIVIGFEHTGYGGPVTDAFPVDYSRPHRITVDMPPLYPPVGDPYFDGIPPKVVEAFNTRLRVSFDDGPQIIDTAARFHPPFAVRPSIGSGGANQAALGRRFTGEILGVRRLSPDWTAMAKAALTGPLVIVLEFPAGQAGVSEPIVSSGVTGRGDVLVVHYVDSNHVTFTLDHWGYGGPTSGPVEIKPGVQQTLVVSLGSFFPASERPSHALASRWSDAAGRLEVTLDNHKVFDVRTPSYDAPSETVVVGRNQIGSTSCQNRFSGRIIGYFRGDFR